MLACQVPRCRKPLGRIVWEAFDAIESRIGRAALVAELVARPGATGHAAVREARDGRRPERTSLVTDRVPVPEGERLLSPGAGRVQVWALGAQAHDETAIPLPAIIRCRRRGHLNAIVRDYEGGWRVRHLADRGTP